MPTSPDFWRNLRRDFEAVQAAASTLPPVAPYRTTTFRVWWSSSPPLAWATREQLPSNWTWYFAPDASLRVRLEAIALRGAKQLGFDSADSWFDKLRESEFVQFQITVSSRSTRADGVVVESVSGEIDDVLKHSITLCHLLEADADVYVASHARGGSVPSAQDAVNGTHPSQMWDVFVSHSSADKPRVRDVVTALRSEGLSVWLDEEQIQFGDRVTEKIETGLARSKRIIVCLSPMLATSNWVRAEYGSYLNEEFTRQGNARVIPLVIEPVTTNEIPVLLRDKLRADFAVPSEWERLLATLRS